MSRRDRYDYDGYCPECGRRLPPETPFIVKFLAAGMLVMLSAVAVSAVAAAFLGGF